jgi:crotonobetainyl-CoA:carnitine CoA-transferase CaiB-like acyl-CoA transferase
VAEGLRSPEARTIPVDLDGIEMRLPESPFVMNGKRIEISNTAPQIGEQTDEILRDAGFADAEIADFRAKGAIRG